MYKDILDSLVDMVQLYTDYAVVVGSNPTKESIAVTGFATTNVSNLDRDVLQTYDVTINGKSADQEQLLSDMATIHRSLTVRKDFPHDEKWQIFSIETSASPRLLGTEEADRTRYLYGSSITVKYYALGMRGEEE